MKVKVLVYNQESKIFKTEWLLDLATIPYIGSKIVYQPIEDKDAYVYDVVEVRFGDNQLVDVLVRQLADLTTYNSSLGSTT